MDGGFHLINHKSFVSFKVERIIRFKSIDSVMSEKFGEKTSAGTINLESKVKDKVASWETKMKETSGRQNQSIDDYDTQRFITKFFRYILNLVSVPAFVYGGWHLTNNEDKILSWIGWFIIIYASISLLISLFDFGELSIYLTIGSCLVIGALILWLGPAELFWVGIVYLSVPIFISVIKLIF